jgi:hypothetical protein
MSGTNIVDVVNYYIQEWTGSAPMQANPKGPVILAEPEYLNQITSNPNLSIVLVKALYGYGKTYGFGYGIYHKAREIGRFDAIYINARGVRAELEKVGGPYSLKKEPRDIIRIVCGGFQRGLVNNDNNDEYRGIYLATNLGTLSAVCNNFEKYINSDNSLEALRQFYRDLVKLNENRKRVILIIDEFERTTGEIDKPDPETVFLWIHSTLQALRPGVLDEHPSQLTLVFLIQELYYPRESMKKLIEESAHPALGRMFSVNADGSVPVKYSEESFINYIKKIIVELAARNVISLNTANSIIGIFQSISVRKLFREHLANTPASIAFSIINELIRYVIVDNDATTDDVINEFKKMLNDYPIYEIYAGKRTVAKGEYLANAASGLLKRYYESRNISVVTNKILRVGFEGAYTVTGNELKAVIFRLSDVDDAQKYINEFKRLYGSALKEYCAQQQPKGRTQNNCEISLLFTQDVNVGLAYNALTRLNMIDGIRVAFNVKPIELTYDDLFVIIAGYNDVNITSGIRKFVDGRLDEIIKKIFM